MPKTPPPLRPTNPAIWCAAVLCAIVAIAVTITGIIVFVGYIIIHPKLPVLTVSYANLNQFSYSQSGTLAIQMTVVIRAKNENMRAHASFYDVSFILGFHGVEIANLVADPFEVEKNSSMEFNYLVESSPIPLSTDEQNNVQSSFRENLITFDLKGNARTRWRIGFVGSVKFWLHLNCELNFFAQNRSITNSHCSSKSK
ncbi:hypothetical protein LguiA_033733 [Lonicera macranthoides]